MPVDFESYDPDENPPGGGLRLTDGSNALEILQFLASNPGEGFTPLEIGEATGIPRGSVGTTLSRLEERELVRHKEPYWAIGDDDNLGAYAAMIHGLDAAENRFGDEDWGDWRSYAVDPRTRDTETDDIDD